MHTQAKHIGQKYMGIRPSSHADEMFKAQSLDHTGGGHSVPVSNFLNAQCEFPAL